MPNYRISITSSDQGNRTVAESQVTKPTRDLAITEGIAELLRQDQFPPEAVQFWVRGMAGASNPAEQADVHDLMMEKFHLQFFCKEAEDVVPAPNPLEMAVKAANERARVEAIEKTPSSKPSPATFELEDYSPRQLLQTKLKDLNMDLRHLRTQKATIDRKFASLKAQRDECLRLLKTPTQAPAKRVRHIQRVEA